MGLVRARLAGVGRRKPIRRPLCNAWQYDIVAHRRSSEYLSALNDRRSHARTMVAYEIDFEYYTLDGQRLGSGHGETLNVSAGGIMLVTDEPLEATMQVLVQIVTPLTMFIARGTVAHARQ